MGFSASLTPPTVIQSITKVDVATNTTDNDCSSSPISTINPVKHLSEAFTQIDELQIDVKTDQKARSEENDNTD